MCGQENLKVSVDAIKHHKDIEFCRGGNTIMPSMVLANYGDQRWTEDSNISTLCTKGHFINLVTPLPICITGIGKKIHSDIKWTSNTAAKQDFTHMDVSFAENQQKTQHTLLERRQIQDIGFHKGIFQYVVVLSIVAIGKMNNNVLYLFC